jgi:hypothetical protein
MSDLCRLTLCALIGLFARSRKDFTQIANTRHEPARQGDLDCLGLRCDPLLLAEFLIRQRSIGAVFRILERIVKPSKSGNWISKSRNESFHRFCYFQFVSMFLLAAPSE